ncbi:MAG: DNA internalization-related competence protein ComEC/Rec2 [Candidatus Accumulibacter sp.]|jgi:competence protein ComEC|nr:DNA internalization-related competence protein ComEC/Rec2 [Accumulibacter sp.]
MRGAILAFAAGILFLQWQAVLPGRAAVSACLVLGLGGLFLAPRRAGMVSRGVLLCACALLGFAWAAWRAECRLADQLPRDWEVRDIQLSGVVAALPQRFERGERFAFDVESVTTPGARVPRRILLSWYRAWDDAGENEDAAGKEENAARNLRPGERWRFTVRLKRPHGNANPHGFDYEAWLLERGFRATGTVRARDEAARLDEFVWRPGYAVERMRDALRQRFRATLPEAPYAGVLIALAIGDQRAIPGAQWEMFRRTGITHLISISGLHVTMLAALCAVLANALWRRGERLMLWLPAQKAAVAIGWLAALAYTVLAGFEVPAQRTLYMLSVVVLALCSGRNLGVIRTLLLALLAVLIFDPWAVLAVGFWLSFGAVAVLFFVGAARVGENPRETEGARRWQAGLRQWGAAQWAVTLGGLPLLLLFFQQFSLVSPLANAVAIPVVSFAVTPLALIYVLIPWPPVLHFDHWLLARLMDLLGWLADWPVWQQPAPPSWSVPLALAGVIWLLLPRGFPARWLGLCLLAPMLAMPPARPPPGEAWVDVLDVGQGLAVLVRTAEHALLYDTGPRYGGESNAGQRIVVPFLRAVGVARLDALVVSHRDKDHAGGMEAVRAHGAVARFLTSIAGIGAEPCVAGQSWEWDGVRFAILHPLESDYVDRAKQPNSMSCVLRVWNDGGGVLLAGDVEARDERVLTARAGGQLRNDVLVVPHHGGRGSSSPVFVAAVAPRNAVFSAGYRNGFGHPRAEVLERYAASRQWRTDRDGAVRVILGAETRISVWRAERPRYWHDGEVFQPEVRHYFTSD